jgi:hypothetical protein
VVIVRSAGVDALAGEGLDKALTGVRSVVDVSDDYFSPWSSTKLPGRSMPRRADPPTPTRRRTGIQARPDPYAHQLRLEGRDKSSR